jgi:hypothetical protein
MKHTILILLTTATLHAQQPPLTIQERLLIQQNAILAEQNDHLQYVEDQIRRAELQRHLQERIATKEYPLMPTQPTR